RGGDAAIAGDLRLSGPPAPLTAKAAGAPPGGGPATDRFFNAYVGGRIWEGGAPTGADAPVDQPFKDRGFANYFQRVPDVAGLAARLDYRALKEIAQLLRVYWLAVPVQGGWRVENPALPHLGAVTFEEATRLGGLGSHDGRFAFVDAPPGLQGAGTVDAAPLASLPAFTVSAPYYTEGLIYVAGSVTFAGAAGTRAVDAEAGGAADARYDEAVGALTRQDLPIDFAPGSVPVGTGRLEVNLKGALYVDGELVLTGGPSIYGAVVAERGVRDGSTARIGYDPRWREAQVGLCTQCCQLRLGPVAPRVGLGDVLALTAQGGQGAVTWQSLAPQVATVDALGTVTPVALGRALVRAVDEAGCVAEVEVQVGCDLTVESLAGSRLLPNQQTTVVARGHRAEPRWQLDAQPAAAIAQVLGPSVVLEALAPGAATLTATDPVAGCSASLEFQVNPCPAPRELRLAPDPPRPGELATATVQQGAADVSAQYTFTFVTDAGPLDQQSLVSPATPFTYQARLRDPSGACRLGPVQVRPIAP
ncbi:MAG: Ig-like domain-containing protein, partial [Deferrisomatales bacterium]